MRPWNAHSLLCDSADVVTTTDSQNLCGYMVNIQEVAQYTHTVMTAIY